MSRETLQWLNDNTLIGFTASRGNAWHWRQGSNNHFPGMVPIERVRAMFDWEPVVLPVTYSFNGWARESDRILVLHGRTGDVMGVFKESYQPHSYGQWLLDKVEILLDDSLQVGSAGLLRSGAIAWVSVEVPESIDVEAVGEKIRPSLLATTSFDGSIATTYKRLVTRVVCDNTLSYGLAEKSNTIKVKHTRDSKGRLATLTSRDALGIVFRAAETLADEIKSLACTSVTKRQWSDFLAVYVPMPEEHGRAKTQASNRREKLETLYTADHRVAPWSGTAWGVLQAVNTYHQHEGVLRGTLRAERNMENAIKGKIQQEDEHALSLLNAVLS